MRALRLSTLLVLLFQKGSAQCPYQQPDTAFCTRVLAITHHLCEWKPGQTEITYPLMTARLQPSLPHGQLSAHTRFYSNAAQLPGEYLSEYGIDERGRCDFVAYLGPYPPGKIDTAGARLRAAFLQCVPWWEWEIDEVPDTYLFLNFNPINVTISLHKCPAVQSGKYNLVVSMFRSTCIR